MFLYFLVIKIWLSAVSIKLSRLNEEMMVIAKVLSILEPSLLLCAIVNLNPIWQALESPWKPISEQIPEGLFPLD